MQINFPIYILEKGKKQKICKSIKDSSYKINVVSKKLTFPSKFKKKVVKTWKEFKEKNRSIAKDRITYFLAKNKDNSEDLVFPERFRYVQSIGKTKEFQDCSYDVYALSSLCLVKTSDNKFIFGIKKNMGNKVSGFSGYPLKKDLEGQNINIFNYLARTLKEELNVDKKNIYAISKIGKTFSNKIVDKKDRLNNRVYNNIYLIELYQTEKQLKAKFKSNFQFGRIFFLNEKQMINFLLKNYENFSVHCIGAIYCYLSLLKKQKILSRLMRSKIKHLIKEKETILITGACGFIGEYLTKKFHNRYNIIGIDNLGKRLDSMDKFYKVDIKNSIEISKIFQKNKVDYVIHTAANKNLNECENQRDKTYEINYKATKNLYDESKKRGAKFIYISSDMVFDGKSKNYTENSIKHPVNHYGTLKDFCEEFLVKDPSVVICRTAMVFGAIPENQEDFFNKVKAKNFLGVQGYILDHVLFRLKNKKRIILPKDEFCSPTDNNLLHRQLKAVIEKDVSGILHCCGNERISKYNFGKKIAKFCNLDISLIDSKSSNDSLRPKDVSLNSSITQKKLGFEFDGINQMIKYRLGDKK